MVAYEKPDLAPGENLWGAVALANMFQHLSQYRVLLLTDVPTFPDGKPVADVFGQLGVEVRHLQAPSHGLPREFVKLQAWNLTDLEKVVLVEPDSVAYRDMDWLFTREGMWASLDDPLCLMEQKGTDPSVMLLYPDAHDFLQLLRYATSKAKSFSYGHVVTNYFSEVKKERLNLLSEVEASLGTCIGNSIPSPYRNLDGKPVTGAWSTPAFVHKSGGVAYRGHTSTDNVCFSPYLDRQTVKEGGKYINFCHYHALAAYWRVFFCKVAHSEWEPVGQFCSDACYYQGLGTECHGVKE